MKGTRTVFREWPGSAHHWQRVSTAWHAKELSALKEIINGTFDLYSSVSIDDCAPRGGIMEWSRRDAIMICVKTLTDLPLESRMLWDPLSERQNLYLLHHQSTEGSTRAFAYRT